MAGQNVKQKKVGLSSIQFTCACDMWDVQQLFPWKERKWPRAARASFLLIIMRSVLRMPPTLTRWCEERKVRVITRPEVFLFRSIFAWVRGFRCRRTTDDGRRRVMTDSGQAAWSRISFLCHHFVQLILFFNIIIAGVGTVSLRLLIYWSTMVSSAVWLSDHAK